MAELLLTSRELDTIEQLLTTLPGDGGDEVVPERVLRKLTELFRGAVICVSEIDRLSGTVLRTTMSPVGFSPAGGPSLRVTIPAAHPNRSICLILTRAQPPFRDRDRVLFRLLTPGLHELGAQIRQQREVQGLSPSEVRVLGLVAQGASNREVSDSLLLSVATVRKHLEHVYAKLGVSNRTAAAARAFPRDAG